jgi:hypothetical protein
MVLLIAVYSANPQPLTLSYTVLHVTAANRYINNRINTYMLSEEKKKREEDIIETILQNNAYHTNRILSNRQLKHP